MQLGGDRSGSTASLQAPVSWSFAQQQGSQAFIFIRNPGRGWRWLANGCWDAAGRGCGICVLTSCPLPLVRTELEADTTVWFESGMRAFESSEQTSVWSTWRTKGDEPECREPGPPLLRAMLLPSQLPPLRAVSTRHLPRTGGARSTLCLTESSCSENPSSREGVYEISLSPTGVSTVRLYPGFIDLKEADWMLERLCQDVPWKQRTGIRENITYQQPRLTAWYGELPYTYSRITMEPNPHWHPVLSTLKRRIEENTGYSFNSLLCNLYRNEKDSVDWHSDDEPSLGRCPVIASLSFGATRTFEMRKKPSAVSDMWKTKDMHEKTHPADCL
ncbi:alpha-ketoglutarate-dependent dioxygenase alkB homolog 3 isoform X3 [Lepus europaeus]|uniref:alpha-ketoglutarate-dependent dioxygenase alkB homolog 3 isoform X3 n=1 Tax=Lepus europaeus TaxID=9983 RepID=UPI002B48C7D6|nr:alpha-ketoglutarate-dependent dioxygenase alkB homolog 3 isoform X3 [Lepus europaeus]